MPTSPNAPRATRRALLAGAVSGAAVLVTGCEALGPSAPGGAGPSPTAPPGVVPPVAGPDRVLLTEVGAATAGLITTLERTAQQRPRLAPRLAPLLRMHRAHQEVLTRALAIEGAAPPTSPSPPPSPSPSPVPDVVSLDDVRAREQALHDRLVADAGTASDGAVARLLAVLAAAVSQQLHQPGEGQP